MGNVSCSNIGDRNAKCCHAESNSKDIENIRMPPAETAPNLIVFSDPGQDLDDEMAFIMLRHLVHEKRAKPKGIITTLNPSYDRARLCRGTLDTLGLYDVPVGVGSDGGDLKGVHKAETFQKWAHAYMPLPASERASHLEPDRFLLEQVFEHAEPKSLTILVIASLKDIALFLRDQELLFVSKTKEVVIMGGVQPFKPLPGVPVELLPDSAHNQEFDREASLYVYRQCQLLRVPLVVISRWAAYAAKVPRSCYDELASMGSVIGCRLRNAQRASIESLWTRASSSEESGRREGLPARCDAAWFLKTFCGGSDLGKKRGPDDSIWDLVEGFMQYDTIALIACIPQLRSQFFRPIYVDGLIANTQNIVIGISESDHGVAEPQTLSTMLTDGFRKGLALNHRYKPQFILVAEPLWNDTTDILLACSMLRTLISLGSVECIGMVISPDPFHGSSWGRDDLNKIRDFLCTLGLSHIDVFISDYKSEKAKSDLLMLYERVGPSGVTLVVTGVLGTVQQFLSAHPKLVREKTQVVIHLGGAIVGSEEDQTGKETGCPWIRPDKDAQSNRFDIDAAQSFYGLMQELLIPMLIISKHCILQCTMPLCVFQALKDRGGRIGADLHNTWKTSVQDRWNAAHSAPDDTIARRGLPEICDRDWFIRRFCSGKVPSRDEDVTSALSPLLLVTSLAILATLPKAVSMLFNVQTVQVRSVSHRLIGRSTSEIGIKDIDLLRSCLYQGIFMGVRLNASEYTFGEDDKGIQLDNGFTWRFDSDNLALRSLRTDIFNKTDTMDQSCEASSGNIGGVAQRS